MPSVTTAARAAPTQGARRRRILQGMVAARGQVRAKGATETQSPNGSLCYTFLYYIMGSPPMKLLGLSRSAIVSMINMHLSTPSKPGHPRKQFFNQNRSTSLYDL